MNSKPFETVKYMLQLFGIWESSGCRGYARKIVFIVIYIIFNTNSFFGLYTEIGNANLEVLCSKIAMFTVGGYGSTVILFHHKREYQSWLTGMYVVSHCIFSFHEINVVIVWTNFPISFFFLF